MYVLGTLIFCVSQIATLLSKKIEEHKTFFSKLPSIISSFEAVKTSKDAASIPKQQLEGIEQRLNTIAPRAAQRKIKLKYLEHRVSVNTIMFFSPVSIFFFTPTSLVLLLFHL